METKKVKYTFFIRSTNIYKKRVCASCNVPFLGDAMFGFSPWAHWLNPNIASSKKDTLQEAQTPFFIIISASYKKGVLDFFCIRKIFYTKIDVEI